MVKVFESPLLCICIVSFKELTSPSVILWFPLWFYVVYVFILQMSVYVYGLDNCKAFYETLSAIFPRSLSRSSISFICSFLAVRSSCLASSKFCLTYESGNQKRGPILLEAALGKLRVSSVSRSALVLQPCFSLLAASVVLH